MIGKISINLGFAHQILDIRVYPKVVMVDLD